MPFLEIPPSQIGLTRFNYWDDKQPNSDLRGQLKKGRIQYSEAPIRHPVGTDGTASLVFYNSPKSGKPITVLVVAHRPASFSEDYFYFEGMTKEQALRDEEWWLIAYEAAEQLVYGAQKAKWLK